LPLNSNCALAKGAVFGKRVEQSEREILLPRSDRGRGERPIHGGQVVGLAHDDVRDLRGADLRKERCPVEVRRGHLQFGARALVVSGVAIAAARAVPLRLGQHSLERENPLRGARRIGTLCQGEELSDVADVRLAHGRELFIVAQVVVAIGHPETRLRDEHGVDVRLARVLSHVDRQRHARADSRRAAEGRREIAAAADGVDRLELPGERLRPERLDAPFLDEALVEVANLLTNRTARTVLRRLAFDDAANRLLGALAQAGEGAVARPVGRNWRRIDPFAVDVTEEIVLRQHG
jgi:hypothetical protein